MTQKLKWGIGVGAIIVIGMIVILVRFGGPENTQWGAPNNPYAQIPSTTKGTTATTTSQKQYTMADVALHNDGASCWSVVRGNVYDLSGWISAHPGGAGAILSMCGIDATDAFLAQHGGQRRPEQELASFLIGSLKQ